MSRAARALIDELADRQALNRQDLLALLAARTEDTAAYLFERARAVRHAVYGRDIYVRGLIEYTNHCSGDCYYCGIRRSNGQAERYRLSPAQVLQCCAQGYALGLRTFVLQGGEDIYYTDERMEALVRAIKTAHPDCAVTLSVGERSREAYAAWRQAGADRYLLRHETANATHYGKLHPPSQTLANRLRCLHDLKDLGYQVGCGFMVGSPYQTHECLADDLLFIRRFEPHMVGIGPFIPHRQTPFAREPAGSLGMTLYLLGIVRLLLPGVLLPATTALGTIDPLGREKGVLAGANVVMPNLSPADVREKYMLYDNKLCTGDEAAQAHEQLQRRMQRIGYRLVVSRGDYIGGPACAHGVGSGGA